MPITIEIDAVQNLRITRFTGVITDEELVGYAAQLREGFDPTLHAIVDIQTSDLQLSASGVRAVAQAMETPPVADGKRKVALVAPDDLSFGFSRMYQSLHASEAYVKVFRDYDEALGWVTDPNAGADDDVG